MLTVFWYNLTQPWLFCAMHVHVNKRFTSCVWTSFINKYFLPMELNITFFYKSKSLISLIFGWCLYHRHKPQPIHTRAVQTLDHDLKWGCMRTFELLHFKLFCPTARNDSVRSVCYTFGISFWFKVCEPGPILCLSYHWS